jgi:hypothetical protein
MFRRKPKRKALRQFASGADLRAQWLQLIATPHAPNMPVPVHHVPEGPQCPADPHAACAAGVVTGGDTRTLLHRPGAGCPANRFVARDCA